MKIPRKFPQNKLETLGIDTAVNTVLSFSCEQVNRKYTIYKLPDKCPIKVILKACKPTQNTKKKHFHIVKKSVLRDLTNWCCICLKNKQKFIGRVCTASLISLDLIHGS